MSSSRVCAECGDALGAVVAARRDARGDSIHIHPECVPPFEARLQDELRRRGPRAPRESPLPMKEPTQTCATCGKSIHGVANFTSKTHPVTGERVFLHLPLGTDVVSVVRGTHRDYLLTDAWVGGAAPTTTCLGKWQAKVRAELRALRQQAEAETDIITFEER